MHEFSSTWAWVVGIGVGFFLFVFFFINGKLALLFYVLVMPVLQPLMTVVTTIPGSTATVALGGLLQTLTLIAALWAVARSKFKSLKAPAVSIFVVLWLIMGISIVESPDRIKAVKEWGRIGSFIFIYVLAAISFRDDRDIKQFVRVLLLSVVVPSGLAVFQLITHGGASVSKLDPYERVVGSFGNPQGLAIYLAFPLLICITMALDAKLRPDRRALWVFGAALLGFLLFFTYTRSVWFGMGAGLLLIGLERNRSLLLTVPMSILLVLIAVPLRFLRLGEFSTGRVTFNGRITNWVEMLPLVKDHPILGRGLTGFSAYTQSDHIRLLLETGFLGWICFLCLVLILLVTLHRAYRSSDYGIERNFVLAYMAFFVLTLVIGFAETNAMFQYWVWIPAGVALCKTIGTPARMTGESVARSHSCSAEAARPCGAI